MYVAKRYILLCAMMIRVETGLGKGRKKGKGIKSRCAMCPTCERGGERREEEGRGGEGRDLRTQEMRCVI